MIGEHDPVAPDEVVVRLVWTDYYSAGVVPPVLSRAFLPRADETDGISVFRAACLADPADALGVIAEAKRDKYAIALLPVPGLLALVLTVRPAPIAAVPGHAVLPELNVTAVRAGKDRWKAVMAQLAELASANVIRRPAG